MFFACFVNQFGKIYNWWQDKNEYFTTKSAKINPFFFAYFSWFLFFIVRIKFKFNFMPPWDKETGDGRVALWLSEDDCVFSVYSEPRLLETKVWV